MITTFVLIVHLQAGLGLRVEVVPNLLTCIVKAQIAMQLEEVIGTQCLPSLGYDA